MGTQVTCNETDDDRDWAWVLELLELLGPKHVMALAVGNEMDRFCFFGEPECRWVDRRDTGAGGCV
ncbi:Hypothetical protein SCF082_LOCUS35088 [Durusdinium trenchii]|uniref:Subtilisin n=1 Tax=Durusdinium trenchii TaxID=1381693 RepID=A0ABP0P4K6_9DINO